MLGRIPPSCHVCLHSQALRKLKDAICEIQGELRLEWKASPVIQLDQIFPCAGENVSKTRVLDWFVLNDNRKPTPIPSYTISDRTWERAFFINPLEVDWLRFEVHDTTDMDFLISAVDILQDMQDLWIHNADTCDQFIMRLFIRFTRALKRLFIFAIHSSYGT
jgi:hypothetical protein